MNIRNKTKINSIEEFKEFIKGKAAYLRGFYYWPTDENGDDCIEKLYPVLAESAPLQRLQVILSRKNISSNGANKLATAMKSCNCVPQLELILKGNPTLRTEGIQHIAGAIAESSLESLSLDLSSCQLTLEQMKLLALACANTAVKKISLDLQENALSDKHIAAFFEGLKANVSAARNLGKSIPQISLNLRFNHIQNVGLLNIADFLASGLCPDGFYLEVGVNQNLIDHYRVPEEIETGCTALTKAFERENPARAKIKLYNGRGQGEFLFPALKPSLVSMFRGEADSSMEDEHQEAKSAPSLSSQ